MSFFLDCQKRMVDLQRKVTETGKNVILRTQMWRRLSTLAWSDCDVVLTFNQSATDENISWFISLLRKRVPRLLVQKQYHGTSGQTALYLTACYRDLLVGAEELRLKKLLRPEHGGGLREFSVEEMDLFQNVQDEAAFLLSSERSSIVYHFLMNLCAHAGDTWNHVRFTDGQPMIRSLQSAGFLDKIFPVHNQNELSQLSTCWVREWNFHQPLDKIRDYFGVEIALYFAWLGHYTLALTFPSILGFLVWLFIDPKKHGFYYFFMTIISLIWSSIYLEHWKRTSCILTYHWGTWDKPPALLEEPRAAFKGSLAACPITGRPVRTYPNWRRKLLMCFVTGPVIVCSLAAVVLITFGFVLLQDRTDAFADQSVGKMGTVIVYFPKILLALVIALMDVGYRHLAIWLTDVENHLLDAEYHTHLVAKLLLLQIMNSFYSLFYTAFYLQVWKCYSRCLSTARKMVNQAAYIKISA